MTENIKMMGDDGVGKSTLLVTFMRNRFPTEEDIVPTICYNLGRTVLFQGRHFNLGFWDTAGVDEYDRIRHLEYIGTNVYLILFDVSNRQSFERVETKWVPEIQNSEHGKGVPYIIAGTKTDLRETRVCVHSAEGMEMAFRLGAVSYLECSSLRMDNVTEVFHEVLTIFSIEKNKLGNFLPKKNRFDGKSKRGKKSSDVVSTVEDYRKYNFQSLFKPLKMVKKELSNHQKEVKSLKKHLPKLSDDVIFHIFHHFYLFDFRTSCAHYHREHTFYKRELESMKLNWSEDFFLQCFGYYFSEDDKKEKRVFQLFYNFLVRSYSDLSKLPKLKKSLIFFTFSPSFTPPEIRFHDYLNKNVFETPTSQARHIFISELINITYPSDFKYLSKFLDSSKKKQTMQKLDMILTTVFQTAQEPSCTYDFVDFLNRHCSKNLESLTLRRNRPEQKDQLECHYDTNNFILKDLRKLVTDRFVMNESFCFSKCQSLEDVTFIGSMTHLPLEISFQKRQLADLLQLQNLRKIRFIFYNLVSLEDEVGLLLSEYEGPVEEIILFRCSFKYQYLSTCSFENLRNLRILVITHTKAEGQEEFPKEFLMLVGEKTKDFVFLLRSSSKGSFSNMKQEVKMKILADNCIE